MTRLRTVSLLCVLLYTTANYARSDTANPSGSQSSLSGGSLSTGGQLKSVNDLQGGQPIAEPFKKYFDKCALMAMGMDGGGTQTASLGGMVGSSGQPGRCRFIDMGISRDAHKGPPSCHKSDEAIDVGAIDCGGGKITPESHKETYMEFAKCMASQTDDNFKVIYLDEKPVPNMMVAKVKGKHKDHCHIQLKRCRPTNGKNAQSKRKK